MAVQVQSLALAWHIFALHHRPFELGLIGLTLFVPTALLVLVAGLFADRHDRRAIALATTATEFGATLAIWALVQGGTDALGPYLAALLAIGVARAFGAPAKRSLLVTLVAQTDYLRTTAAYSAASELVGIGGPALAGALVAIGTGVALLSAAALAALSLAGLWALRIPSGRSDDERPPTTWESALGGLHFIRSQPVILAAISLDLFAVLFGGATALLPAYADTILRVGPLGLGILRSAPAAGAGLTAIVLARRPIRTAVGRTLLANVALFGDATIVFGLSRTIWLSVAALAVAGAADMVSVVIRNGLVQLGTPDAMRGRVLAVENVFIGASNELGAFESGTLAALIGVVPSVVVGGVATLVVVAWCARAFPSLRQLERFAVTPPG